MDKISKFLQEILSSWESLDFNIKLVAVIWIMIVLFSSLYISFVHVDVSNSGKLLWNSRSYRYIDIQPKEDYISLLKPDNIDTNTRTVSGGDTITSKIVTINNQTITISYKSDPEAQTIINEIGIHKIIDPIKLAEYATKKVNSILYDNDKELYRDIEMFFTKLDLSAGAYFSDSIKLTFNWAFIKNRYDNMTKNDFIKYYIGLYIHELTHTFTSRENKKKNNRLNENICEYIRMVSGFQPSTWKVTATNTELPTQEYGAEGAYFLYWVEENYPGFIKKILEDKLSSDENKYYLEHTGKSLKELWKEFQGVLYVL